MEEINQADAGVTQHDPPLLQLVQVTFQRPGQLRQVTAGETATVVRGLLPDGGDGLVLRQRLLRVADSLEQRFELQDQRIRFVDAVERFRHPVASSGGDGRHDAEPRHHLRQALEDEVDVSIGVALADREPQAAQRAVAGIAQRQDHVARLQ